MSINTTQNDSQEQSVTPVTPESIHTPKQNVERGTIEAPQQDGESFNGITTKLGYHHDR
jgi:hypothetical protein